MSLCFYCLFLACCHDVSVEFDIPVCLLLRYKGCLAKRALECEPEVLLNSGVMPRQCRFIFHRLVAWWSRAPVPPRFTRFLPLSSSAWSALQFWQVVLGGVWKPSPFSVFQAIPECHFLLFLLFFTMWHWKASAHSVRGDGNSSESNHLTQLTNKNRVFRLPNGSLP